MANISDPQEEEGTPLIPRWIRELENSYEVIEFQKEKGKYIITTQSYGIIDFFPKANRVLIRKTNDWTPEGESGLDWITTYLINKTDNDR